MRLRGALLLCLTHAAASVEPDLKLSSIGQNPCGPLAGNRDRDRRPCEGISRASATRPVASARTAPRQSRGADPRSAGLGSTATPGCATQTRRSFSWMGHSMPDTYCATPRARPAMPPNSCAMISRSPGPPAVFPFVFREARRSTTMMSAERSTLSLRALLFLFAVIGIPGIARSSNLEDSAKELARKIAAALPAGENISYEIRNISLLKPGEAARIDQALKAELQERGIHLTSGGAACGQPRTPERRDMACRPNSPKPIRSILR